MLLGWEGMALTIVLNGRVRVLDGVAAGADLAAVIAALELKADRVAVELNGAIVRRTAWSESQVGEGDKLEVVHFVGGGRGD